MIEELIAKIVDFFNDIFEIEELNGDFCPGNFIEIINKNGKKEVIKYE